jgi:hypothetical protein
MQNILILILVSNILSLVKSFSIDYRYSNNHIYSYYFVNSRAISYYSNYFNSNQLSYNYYSKYFNSNTLKSISDYHYTKSYNSFNNYLSIIKTMPSQSISDYQYSISAPTLAPTFATTLAPTFAATSAPTSAPTLAPTFVTTSAPTLAPTFVTTSAPTLAPTFATTSPPTPNKKQTEMPTIQEVPTISFDTKLTFDNYDSEELDTKSQEAIIIATANSMNISDSYVKYVGSTLKTRRLSIFKSLGFNIIITLKTTIPLQDETDPNALYTTITTNLINSVNSGLFTTYLITASNTLGTTSFANVSILSVQNDDYVIKQPDKLDIKEKETPKIYTTIYIIFGVLLSVYLLMYFLWLRKKYLNNIRRLRNLFEGMINTDDISIRIVEN